VLRCFSSLPFDPNTKRRKYDVVNLAFLGVLVCTHMLQNTILLHIFSAHSSSPFSFSDPEDERRRRYRATVAQEERRRHAASEEQAYPEELDERRRQRRHYAEEMERKRHQRLYE
jgi:hypothetical protein